MADIIVGDKYLTAKTDRNKKNGILPNQEARIAHVGTAISVTVIQSGGYIKLAVPRDAFGLNFTVDRAAVVMANSYRSPVPFTRPYL